MGVCARARGALSRERASMHLCVLGHYMNLAILIPLVVDAAHIGPGSLGLCCAR